ncbi:MAG TPA: DoxX family protein [Terriglobales bacterium]|nr:DoxX family protein [Terriglobales bacterium]
MSNGAASHSSSASWGLTVLRVIVGVVFLVHGSQKVFGFGYHGVTGMFAHIGIPLPAISAAIVMTVEFLGGIALILGLTTRLAASLLAIDMIGAILMVHMKNGFFNPTGFEYPLTLLGAAICLALAGSGAASVEWLFARRGI